MESNEKTPTVQRNAPFNPADNGTDWQGPDFICRF